MKKWSIYFFTFLLLVGCTKTEESENVQANEENNGVQVEEITLTEEEAFNIARKVNDQMFDAYYQDFGGDHGDEDEEEISDEEWLALYKEQNKIIKENLKQFATDNYIENHIFFGIDQSDCEKDDFCSTEFPRNPEYLWKPYATIESNEAFTIHGLDTSRFVSDKFSSFEEQARYVLIDGMWKADSLTIIEKDMNISDEELEEYLDKEFYTSYVITGKDEQYVFNNGAVEVVYFLETVPHANQYIFVPRNGTYYLDRFFWQTEGEEEDFYAEGGYDETFYVDDSFAYLFYDWSQEADNIRTDIQEVNELYARLQQLDNARIESYLMDDEEGLEIILKALITLSEDTYNYFFEIWDETTALSNVGYNRMWFQDMLDYLERLPEDTSDLDRLNTEFVIRYWSVYGTLVTGYN